MQHHLWFAATIVLAGCGSREDVTAPPAAPVVPPLMAAALDEGPAVRPDRRLPVMAPYRRRPAAVRNRELQNSVVDGSNDADIAVPNM